MEIRNRSYRRRQRNKKIEQSKRYVKAIGFQQGSLYKKHVDKITENGYGYFSKHGSLLHYAKGTYHRRKVEKRCKQNFLEE